jgi:hypothetical protein
VRSGQSTVASVHFIPNQLPQHSSSFEPPHGQPHKSFKKRALQAKLVDHLNMDVAYDHSYQEAVASTPSSKDKGKEPEHEKESLNEELQQAYNAISNSPWGTRFGTFIGTVKKQVSIVVLVLCFFCLSCVIALNWGRGGVSE